MNSTAVQGFHRGLKTKVKLIGTTDNICLGYAAVFKNNITDMRALLAHFFVWL